MGTANEQGGTTLLEGAAEDADESAPVLLLAMADDALDDAAPFEDESTAELAGADDEDPAAALLLAGAPLEPFPASPVWAGSSSPPSVLVTQAPKERHNTAAASAEVFCMAECQARGRPTFNRELRRNVPLGGWTGSMPP